MDSHDDITRSDYMVVMICIWYERYNSTYHEINSGGTHRNRGELSTQSL